MFFNRLCLEELNRLIRLPTARHKIERHVMAQKCLLDWIYLGSTAEKTASCPLLPDRNEADERRRLCRQGRAVRQTVTKLLGMIEG